MYVYLSYPTNFFRFCEEGYKAGTEQGKKEGLAEGFATGWQQGCKLGEEVGFYRGFAEGWLGNLASGSSKLHLDDRKLKLVHVSLSQLKQMAGTFEIVSIEKDDFATELTKIRSKFKQVVKQMGIQQLDFGNKDLSF